MKTRKDKRMVKIDFFFSFLGDMLQKWHIHVLVHGRASWSTFGLHLVRGPNTLYIGFLRNQTMEIGP